MNNIVDTIASLLVTDSNGFIQWLLVWFKLLIFIHSDNTGLRLVIIDVIVFIT